MTVVVTHGVEVGQQQRGRMPRRHHRDVVAAEPVDVFADPRHQPVDQAREPEHRAGLHAFHGVLSDDRPGPSQLDAAQRRRPRRRRIGRHLHAGCDRAAEELSLGRHDVDADRRPEVDDDRGRLVLVKCREAVDDPVGSDLLRIVDQQWNAGAHTRLDQNVRHRRPVLFEHLAHLVQHRGNGRQPCRAGEAFGVVADQAVDGQRQLVRRHLGFGADPPLMHHLAVIARSRDQANHGMGVADVDC